MRAPPPVQFDCGPDRLWCLAESTLAALAAGFVLRLAALHLGWAPAGAAALAAPWVGASSAGVLWLRWQLRRRPMRLSWDGQTWRRGDDVVRLACALDLGRWMVLRIQSPRDRRLHVTALPHSAPARHAVRVAVLNHRPDDGLAAHV